MVRGSLGPLADIPVQLRVYSRIVFFHRGGASLQPADLPGNGLRFALMKVLLSYQLALQYNPLLVHSIRGWGNWILLGSELGARPRKCTEELEAGFLRFLGADLGSRLLAQ